MTQFTIGADLHRTHTAGPPHSKHSSACCPATIIIILQFFAIHSPPPFTHWLNGSSLTSFYNNKSCPRQQPQRRTTKTNIKVRSADSQLPSIEIHLPTEVDLAFPIDTDKALSLAVCVCPRNVTVVKSSVSWCAWCCSSSFQSQGCLHCAQPLSWRRDGLMDGMVCWRAYS